jgi:hypothetical protein
VLSKRRAKNLQILVKQRIEQTRQDKALAAPRPEPRYDEVFALGQEWLDDLAGKPVEPSYGLVPATLVPNDQFWFHHPEMQARIAGSEQDFAKGRTTRTVTPEEAQALLDSLKRHS